MPRKLFVTTALPYANAAFHIGHMMEYIQADTWVRAQRMRGADVNFVCADDAHGAPIMIAADKAGLTPQQFVAGIAAGRAQYLDGFHIGFDNWHSTDAPENHRLAQEIYRALRAQGLIVTRTIEQFYDPAKGMFLPDRFIKGTCPKCSTPDQYGDNCENCGAVYAPTDLVNPRSAHGVRHDLVLHPQAQVPAQIGMVEPHPRVGNVPVCRNERHGSLFVRLWIRLPPPLDVQKTPGPVKTG